jgi:hypothetical protein
MFNVYRMLFICRALFCAQQKTTYNQRAKINAKSNKLSPRDWISKHTKNGISLKNALALTAVESDRGEIPLNNRTKLIRRCNYLLYLPHLNTRHSPRALKRHFAFETINRFHKRHNARHKNIKLHMFLSFPISEQQHDYNKNIFIYINNQFIHFLSRF